MIYYRSLVVTEDKLTFAHVERILNSKTFRNAEVLRRLLSFLAQKSIAGEADHLKEYAVGIDALGKPPDYDPRQDSVVRIQIGRLRHKLADYYRAEGKGDPIVIDIPKGHFRVTWECRAEVSPPAPASETAEFSATATPIDAPRRAWPRSATVAVALMLAWALFVTAAWVRDYVSTAPYRKAWTPELEQIWRPFLASKRPLLVAVGAPLFVGFLGRGFYRDLSLNRWQDVVASSSVQALGKALGNPRMVPRYSYTGVGEMMAALQLGKLLSFSELNVSTVRSRQISWQEMMDSNVIFVGAPRSFGEKPVNLPEALDFVVQEDGIHDLSSDGGRTAVYPDNPAIASRDPAGAPDDGEVYALVSRTGGLLGTGDVEIFNSNYSVGTLGAVQWFTVPATARELVHKLRNASGELPRYFQLVLKVKYRDSAPTEITYVTHRELPSVRTVSERK